MGRVTETPPLSSEEYVIKAFNTIREKFNYPRDEVALFQLRALIDHVVKEFEPDRLFKFAFRVYSYDFDLFLYLVRLSPTLVNAKDGNYTVLHHANGSFPSRVSVLIELGADVNRVSDEGETALDIAYYWHSVSNVQVLLKNGASTMIGIRHWLRWGGDDYQHINLIRRCYYLSLLYKVGIKQSDHLRVLVDILC